MAIPDFSASAPGLSGTAGAGVLRRILPPHRVNHNPHADRNLQATANHRGVPAPSQRQPEYGNQKRGNRDDQKSSVHF